MAAAGYPALFLLVMAESGGIPLPGETALITAAILASQGKLQIELVIAIAALAAITGDNAGYLISRKAGRRLLERPGLFERQRRQVLELGGPFFERRGPNAVFFGRWILGLRTWASWLAGASKMPWRSFAFWNAAGAISWATTIGLVAYFIGNTATNAITAFGLFALLVVVLAGGGSLVLRRLHRSAAPSRRNR
jgi:membrane protein DedA with SNARE-associated domain